MSDNKNNQLQIELPQEVAQGEYANFAIITHSSSDFIVDFARVLPGLNKVSVADLLYGRSAIFLCNNVREHSMCKSNYDIIC